MATRDFTAAFTAAPKEDMLAAAKLSLRRDELMLGVLQSNIAIAELLGRDSLPGSEPETVDDSDAQYLSGEELRQTRERAYLTQFEAARLAGVSIASVRRWEAGLLPVRPSWALPRYIASLDRAMRR